MLLRDRADRRRVVLDDEVVEVEEPQRAVGSDFRVHRRKPLVVAGGDVPAVLLGEARALTLDDRPMDDVAGGLVHEGDAVPVFLGERARRVEVVPRRGGEPALHVHLPDFLRVRLHRVVAVDLLLAVAGQAGDALVVRPRDRHVDAVLAVRGRAEHVEGLVEGEAPRVVREVRHVLHPVAVAREAIEGLVEVQGLPADGAVEARVADRAPDPVVQPVLQVRRQRVGVADAPAADQRLAQVGLVVAVRVFQGDHLSGLRDDDAAIGEDETADDRQLVGEDRGLVGPAVVVGVFQDLDVVVPLAGRLRVVGIVPRLGDPQPPALVPRHRYRVAGDQRLGREELQLEAGRDLHVLRRFGRRERLLQSRRGIPPLVVRDRHRGRRCTAAARSRARRVVPQRPPQSPR